MATTSPVLLNTPYLGPTWKCRYEYAGVDALAPSPTNVMHPAMGQEFLPAGAGNLEFLDRAGEIVWRAIGKAEEPTQFLIPEVGSTGPHLLPLRVSADGSAVVMYDAAGRSALRQTEIADGRNGMADLPFDQANAAAAPELRFVHQGGAVGWVPGNAYGTGWGTALHRRIVPMGGGGQQVQTSFGDNFNYNPPMPGSSYFQPIFPTENALLQTAGPPIVYTELQPNLVAYTLDPSGRCSATNFPNIGNNGGWINFYNGAGALDHVQNMDTGLIVTLSYDGSGHLGQVQNPGGTATNITCDPTTGNLLQIVQAGSGLPPTSLTYDGAGHVSGWTAPNGEITTIGYDVAGRVKSVQCPDGRITTYTWNPGGTPGVAVQDPSGAVNTLVFDGSRRLQSWQDPFNNIHTYTWANDRLQDVMDPLGHMTTMAHTVLADQSRKLQIFATTPAGTPTTFAFGYNSAPLLVNVTDELGNLSTLTWAVGAERTQLVNPLGKIWTFAFSANRISQLQTPLNENWTLVYNNGQRWYHQDPLGALVTCSYNSAGRLVNVATPAPAASIHRDGYQRMIGAGNALGQYHTLSFDTVGRVATILDPAGAVITRTYWIANHLHNAIDPMGRVTSFAYDSAGNNNVRRDPVGNIFTTLFDAGRRPYVQIDPYNNRVTTSYDTANRPVTIANQLGFISSNTFDGADRLTGKTDPLNRTWSTVFDAAGRVQASKNPLNETVTTLFNAGGQPYKSIDQLGKITTRIFDDCGRVCTVTDARNNSTRQQYDPCGRPTTMTNAAGYTSSTTWDAAGRAIYRSNELGNRTKFDYDLANRPVTVTDPLTHSYQTGYDVCGRVVSRTDPLGNMSRTAYDLSGAVTTLTDALGNTNWNVYDGNGRVSRTYDQLNKVTSYAYDNLSRLSSTTDPTGNITTRQYDAASRLTTLINARGLSEVTAYDAAGQATTSTNQLGNVSTMAYDNAARLISSTDPRGNSRQTQYDAAGRPTVDIDALGKRTTHSYDAVGNQIAVQDAAGAISTTSFDAMNRPVTIMRPMRQISTMQYDPAGQMTASIDALGNTTQYGFDAAGRRVTMTDALLHVWTTNYDDANRPREQMDANGKYTTTTYDPVGRVVSVQNALGNLTQYLYDAAGRRTQLIDPRSKVVTFGYDDAGRHTLTVDPKGRATSMGYDQVGNLAWVWDASGVIVTKTYDQGNRLVTEQFSPTKINTYAYDTANNRTTMIDSTGTYTWGFDANNRVTQAVNPDGGIITYSFDNVGRRATMFSPSLTTFIYSYDPNGRLINLANPAQTILGYDDNDRMLVETLANGCIVTYGYDAVGRVTTLINKDPGGNIIKQFTYTYDNVGNKQSVVEGNSTTLTVATTTWQYDDTYQLTDETRVDPIVTVAAYDVAYLYDPAGNRVSMVDGVALTTYAYDDANQLTTLTQGTSVVAYQYDPCGRMTQEQFNAASITYYHWNEDGRLDSVKLASVTVSTTYAYNALGQRVKKQVGAGTATKFLFDFNKVLQEYQPSGTGVQAEYTASAGEWGDLISVYSPPALTTTYHTFNALGSTDAVVNQGGGVVDSWVYRAFGLQQYESAASVDPYRFVGQQSYYWDPDAQLYFFGTAGGRQLRPDQGRPLSPDRAGYGPDVNSYRYCRNNPVNGVDPSGLVEPPNLDWLDFETTLKIEAASKDPAWGGSPLTGWYSLSQQQADLIIQNFAPFDTAEITLVPKAGIATLEGGFLGVTGAGVGGPANPFDVLPPKSVEDVLKRFDIIMAGENLTPDRAKPILDQFLDALGRRFAEAAGLNLNASPVFGSQLFEPGSRTVQPTRFGSPVSLVGKASLGAAGDLVTNNLEGWPPKLLKPSTTRILMSGAVVGDAILLALAKSDRVSPRVLSSTPNFSVTLAKAHASLEFRPGSADFSLAFRAGLSGLELYNQAEVGAKFSVGGTEFGGTLSGKIIMIPGGQGPHTHLQGQADVYGRRRF